MVRSGRGAGFAAVVATALFGSRPVAGSGACLYPQLLFGTTEWKSRYEHICCVVPQRYAEHAGFQSEPGIRFFDRLEGMRKAVEDGAGANSEVVAEQAGAASLDGMHIRRSSDTGKWEFVFYDSQCGIPPFIAPRGRTFEEFKSESLSHGWPSFRDEEVVADSLILRADGEVVSACPTATHLGHRFEDSKGGRYCIDLLCIAGQSAKPMLKT